MRKFVKAAAVLALAFALLSTSAFAQVTADGSSVTANQDGTYSVVVAGAAGGEQVTLLAVDSEAVEYDETTGAPYLDNVTDANILYIDQNATGSFENFQVKGDSVAGKEIFFFAGSTSSNNAVLVGQKQNWLVSINAPNGTTVEAGKPLALSASIQGGTYEGTATWSVTEGAEVTGSSYEATFTAATAGTYTVTYNANLPGVGAEVIVITVTAPSFNVVSEKAEIINTEPNPEVEGAAKEQSGVGVKLTVELPADVNKVIWVFTDGTNRYYSDSIPFEGARGSVTIGAAVANGNTISNTTAKINITGFDAIFRVDDNTEYYTNEALDAPNKNK